MSSEMARRDGLLTGTIQLPEVGFVVETGAAALPFAVHDGQHVEVPSVSKYLGALWLGDQSPKTIRSYSYDLLRWFRVLWALGVDWDKATTGEVAVLVGALRHGVNRQRLRSDRRSRPPGSVNSRTGKRLLDEGYSARTINHNLSVVSEFYKYHAHFGRGPVLNPVPEPADRRNALAHRGPDHTGQPYRRASLRQRETKRKPRAISDQLWDELFGLMTCDRDKALLLFYWTSGARASEILGLRISDIDWLASCAYVISKGTRLREAVPVSAQALRYLLSYLDELGPRQPTEPLWLTRRGQRKPLSYWAFRRIFQRANETLGTNWTLHDLRHTAATRMANDPALTLQEVQAILRHTNITTTGEYLAVHVEDLVDRMQQFYERPKPPRVFAAGYDADDMRTVFGD